MHSILTSLTTKSAKTINLRQYCAGHIVFVKGDMLIESESVASGPIFSDGRDIVLKYIRRRIPSENIRPHHYGGIHIALYENNMVGA